MKKITISINTENAKKYLNGINPEKLIEYDFIYYAILCGEILNYSYDYEELCRVNKIHLESEEFSIHIIETNQLLNYCLNNFYDYYNINTKPFELDGEEYESFNVLGDMLERLINFLKSQKIAGLLVQNRIITIDNLDKFTDLVYCLQNAIEEFEFVNELPENADLIKIGLPK